MWPRNGRHASAPSGFLPLAYSQCVGYRTIPPFHADDRISASTGIHYRSVGATGEFPIASAESTVSTSRQSAQGDGIAFPTDPNSIRAKTTEPCWALWGVPDHLGSSLLRQIVTGQQMSILPQSRDGSLLPSSSHTPGRSLI